MKKGGRERERERGAEKDGKSETERGRVEKLVEVPVERVVEVHHCVCLTKLIWDYSVDLKGVVRSDSRTLRDRIWP